MQTFLPSNVKFDLNCFQNEYFRKKIDNLKFTRVNPQIHPGEFEVIYKKEITPNPNDHLEAFSTSYHAYGLSTSSEVVFSNSLTTLSETDTLFELSKKRG